jgi:hypothetical protein
LIEGDQLHRDLVEIDENLCRSNLTPAHEAAAVARRKAIYEALHPETKAGGDHKSNRKIGDLKEDRFSSATSKATGKSERKVQRAAERGRKIGPENLDKIAGTSLDKGKELDALAKLPEQEQEELIAKAVAGKVVSAAVLAPQEPADEEPGIEDEIDAEDPENYRTAYLLRVDQALRFAAYSGPIAKEIVPAARAVATAWSTLAQKLERAEPATAAAPIATTDDLGIPHFPSGDPAVKIADAISAAGAEAVARDALERLPEQAGIKLCREFLTWMDAEGGASRTVVDFATEAAKRAQPSVPEESDYAGAPEASFDFAVAENRAHAIRGALAGMDNVEISGADFWAVFGKKPNIKEWTIGFVRNALRKLRAIEQEYIAHEHGPCPSDH